MDEIFANINGEINIKEYKKEYMCHLEHLRDNIFKSLKKDAVFSRLYNGVYLKGSYGDNLKVKYPDEYDLVFRLKLPESHRIIVVKDRNVPGNVILDLTEVFRTIANQKQHADIFKYLKKWVTDKNLLSIKLLQSWLERCFTKALDDLNKQIIYKNIVSTIIYRKQGPAHTIFIYTPYKYSVDFVPAIVLNSSQAVLKNIPGNWDAVPKPLKDTPSITSFRASYDSLENEIIKDKKNLKNALRIMKKFRDRHQNMSNLKSYYIKTIFLWRASAEPTCFWNKSINFVIMEMFNDLKTSLVKCKLPYFWDAGLNLYDKIGAPGLLEMRKCVESKVVALERYQRLQVKTDNDAYKVYEIFLTETERRKMGIQKIKSPTVEDTRKDSTQPNEIKSQNDSNMSKCTIS
ncbi:cyclic GMP-AMP synthase-like receptor [Anastrepha obliqua]|uniref:cyclic GMP-AMP synthase-like receptor n=1 Tax=Anastrepha obliqua TaxID=95512 RepID=UPI0024091479|nr:cyclic GMP-AMP synthase-like receptor [Anastrepha obliqua]